MPLGWSQCVARAAQGFCFFQRKQEQNKPSDWRKRANKPDKRLEGKPWAKFSWPLRAINWNINGVLRVCAQTPQGDRNKERQRVI